MLFKGIVHPKMKNLSSFNPPQVVPFLGEQTGRKKNRQLKHLCINH